MIATNARVVLVENGELLELVRSALRVASQRLSQDLLPSLMDELAGWSCFNLRDKGESLLGLHVHSDTLFISHRDVQADGLDLFTNENVHFFIAFKALFFSLFTDIVLSATDL